MNFFDFFRRKKNPERDNTGAVLSNGIALSTALTAYLPQIEASALPFVRIQATPAENLFLFDSKFGGYPYWPKGLPFPKDSNGNYLVPLAQLNFSQMPLLDGYPDKGILQFYVAADDMWGVNFEHPTNQNDFRVVYFENVEAEPEENFHFLTPEIFNDAPVYKQMQLQFSLQTDYVGVEDVRFANHFNEEMLDFEYTSGGKHYLSDEVFEKFSGQGHKMGGYAYFTQYDPRRWNPEFRDWILLLQIDSQPNGILWGDMGVANFFIHPDALAKKDFSNVLYNWDCS